MTTPMTTQTLETYWNAVIGSDRSPSRACAEFDLRQGALDGFESWLDESETSALLEMRDADGERLSPEAREEISASWRPFQRQAARLLQEAAAAQTVSDAAYKAGGEAEEQDFDALSRAEQAAWLTEYARPHDIHVCGWDGSARREAIERELERALTDAEWEDAAAVFEAAYFRAEDDRREQAAEEAAEALAGVAS